MKEHGILFRSDMVRAILEGRKTQTRRLVRLRPDKNHPEWPWQPLDMLPMKDGSGNYVTLMQHNPGLGSVCGYPMGKGDRLWVRETWAHDAGSGMNCKDHKCGIRDHIWWKANESAIVADSFAGAARWRSSMFMPRWASRIDLEILSVRAERVQDITNDEIVAEGIPFWMDAPGKTPSDGLPKGSLSLMGPARKEHMKKFISLWDEIHKKPGRTWADNPWVWVITFKRISP